MMKQRPVPYFAFEGTTFEVDIENQRLVERNNPGNTISFMRDMADRGTHYELAYDLATKNAFDRSGNFYENDNWTHVKVPRLTELDPEGMAEKYGYTLQQMKDKTDYEVIVDQEALALREKGVLPRIDIAGEEFIIDLRLHELRHAAHFYPVLSLKIFELTNDGWNYEAYYHPVLKQIVEIDPKLLEFPEGVIKIKIPNEIGLDPVSTARIYGMDERELLRRYPIQKHLKAEVIPLSETNIPAMIQRNREALRQAHRENLQRAKPRIRPRF